MTNLTLIDKNNEPLDECIKRWSADDIGLFADYYEGLIELAKTLIAQNEEIENYLTDDGYYCIGNIYIEYGEFQLELEEARGCSCCTRGTSSTEMPLDWIVDDSIWKNYLSKRATDKAEKERKEQLEKEQEAERKRIAEEEKEKSDYLRLKEKFET